MRIDCMKMTQFPVMIIVVNADLKLTKGQIASQTAHIVHHMVEKNVRSAYETYPVPLSYKTYLKWCDNPIVIVKCATTVQLNQLSTCPLCHSFYDDVFIKQTKQKSHHLTVVGFSPGVNLQTEIDDLIKNLKLL